jgi:hypothetical protein
MFFASTVLYVLKQMYLPSICRIQTELHFTMMLIVDSKLTRNRFVEMKCKNSVEGGVGNTPSMVNHVKWESKSFILSLNR